MLGVSLVERFNLFADFNGIPKGVDKTEFYQHDQNWSNRDSSFRWCSSCQVLNSCSFPGVGFVKARNVYFGMWVLQVLQADLLTNAST